MYKIIAHRGMWKKAEEQNTSGALIDAIGCSFGFETDVRDYNGKLVISHNIATASSICFDDLFGKIQGKSNGSIFALNIKADGLIELLKDKLDEYHIENYFTFDMSVPQQIEYVNAGINVFTRQSEIEVTPILYDEAKGIWIDGFYGYDWITEGLLNEHIGNGKKICIVSPELHQRKDYMDFWREIKDMRLDSKYIYICTDYPENAKEYFNEN